MFEGSSKVHNQAMQQQQHQYMQQMHHQTTSGGQMMGQPGNINRHVSPAPSPSALSRPHSSANVPDYTQVSPAKMALRRHLSQEKLATPKTIGDLVNGEIERTLEISHQSIINAAVNMSTTHPLPVEVFNVQRPERVNVRGPEDYQQYLSANYRGPDTRRSPGPFSKAHENPKLVPSTSSSSSSVKGTSSNLFMASYTSNSLNTFGYSNNGSGRESSQAPSLPRADMKPYLEQYFRDDHFGKEQTEKLSRNRSGSNSSIARSGEDQDSHRPLEGLAASLQARVRATLNIKEEPEIIARGGGAHLGPNMMLHPHHHHIKQEGELNDSNVSAEKTLLICIRFYCRDR